MAFDHAEWFIWNAETAAEHPWLQQAVAEFEANGTANERAAHDVTRWLHREAVRQGACITRLLVLRDRVAAFYAMSSGEMTLGSLQNLEFMGVHIPLRPPTDWTIGASHIEVIGRDRQAPAGSGMLAIQHAIGVAKLAAVLQGNLAVTLDPADTMTQEMWLRRGFVRTLRRAGPGLRRLYVPLRGPYYGPINRG